MKRFGLIGYPLGHSFSRKYFTEKFRQEGLTDHVYDLFPITSINQLPEIIAANPELVGLNVTIPYKRDVLPYLTYRKMPEGLDACNCIKVRGSELEGYNTDAVGFEKSFSPLLQSFHTDALILGNGGATEAVAFVLRKLGIAYKIVSRSLHNNSSLTYSDLDEQIASLHKVIINTTPLGTFPDVDKCPDIPYQLITEQHYLFDLIYNPPETLFLKKGKERGAIVKNGYEMLEIQAEESWTIWNT